MPGWYIHMNVARRAVRALADNPAAAPIFASSGKSASAISAIGQANPAYVALGAIGPDIFFLLPDFKPPVGSMLWKLANEVREIYSWWDENFLGPYESQIGPIAANASDLANALSGGLKDSIEGIFGQAFSFLKDSILRLILQQYDFFGLLSSGVPAGFDEQTFFWSDMLHYRETYRFATELWQRANNPAIVPNAKLRGRFQAFALGWMSHLATDVTGHGFVNQKTGGPFRLHWQRHHLVENHMDAQVYNNDHGGAPIYNEMSNAALHLWLAFNPDGSSRVDFFQNSPNPPYPPGDGSADIMGRRSVWEFDSDLPEELAAFLADTLAEVYKPALTSGPNGMIACCPTIISSLDGRVPLADKGLPNKEDIIGAYWWLYRFVRYTTTDYYKIRKPEPPELFVIPDFPSPPGSGDSDPGPGGDESDGAWPDFLSFLLSLFAWATYLAEVALWPAAVIAGIVGGTVTYPVRQALYEALELPLYNLWLGLHTYLAMTGYVMPMPGELNSGLNTLGLGVGNGWVVTVAALGDPDGGILPSTISTDPSGSHRTNYPRDVLVDPPNFITAIFGQIFKIGAPEVNGQFPSEFTRPWLFPMSDNQGNMVNLERRETAAGPFVAFMNANSLFGSMPGDPAARTAFEAAASEVQTMAIAAARLPAGSHLGDPQDYSCYVIARLTRMTLDPATVPNFNLDADRGYAYLCWDWTRSATRTSAPSAFRGEGDPGAGGALTNVSQHIYPTPLQPGYGWSTSDQFDLAGQPKLDGFNPDDPSASVRIRYIGKEGKFA